MDSKKDVGEGKGVMNLILSVSLPGSGLALPNSAQREAGLIEEGESNNESSLSVVILSKVLSGDWKREMCYGLSSKVFTAGVSRYLSRRYIHSVRALLPRGIWLSMSKHVKDILESSCP